MSEAKRLKRLGLHKVKDSATRQRLNQIKLQQLMAEEEAARPKQAPKQVM